MELIRIYIHGLIIFFYIHGSWTVRQISKASMDVILTKCDYRSLECTLGDGVAQKLN